MRKQANYKLPEELIEAIQDRAAHERTTATDLVIEALNSYLGLSPEGESSRIGISIAEIVNRLQSVEESLGKIQTGNRCGDMHQNLSDIYIDGSGAAAKVTECLMSAFTPVLEELQKQNQELQRQNQELRAHIAALEALGRTSQRESPR